MMKKMDKKAFTLIELIVVVAVVGILVLLGMPRFIGHKDKAELARIQHDVKVMEQEIGTVLINHDDDFNKWEDNSKDFNQLIQEGKLFEKEGPVAKDVEPIAEPYKVIPEEYKDKINTKLKGTFYANSDGKVYYEHEKPLLGIPIKPEEKEPEYSNEKIEDLVKNHNFIPVATAEELNNVRSATLETYGKGTQWEGPYTGGLDKHYVQVANIDLSEYSKEEEGWNPIGTIDFSGTSESDMLRPGFKGTYDGGNYVIRGLEVKGASKDLKGLFGLTYGATISNVGLIENKVTGSSTVGGLVGYAYNSTISNSYSTGSVTGSLLVGGLVGQAWGGTIENSHATVSVTTTGWTTGWTIGGTGGLVGRVDNGTTISNSYATGEVTGAEYVGGLVGLVGESITISNSYATGSVTGTDSAGQQSAYVGGLVGQASSSAISNSYATGSVKGTTRVGGLVGSTSGGTIENSYATGAVTGSENYVGGLVGYANNSSAISNSYSTGSVTGSWVVGGLVGYTGDSTIRNSYATGKITGTNNVGGLVGDARAGTEIRIRSSYWDINTTGRSVSAGGTGKSTEDMKQSETYEGWDFETVWRIDEGDDYPKLR